MAAREPESGAEFSTAIAVRDWVCLRDRLTLRLPGKARWLTEATTEAELLAAGRWARERQVPLLPLGKGSNLVLRGDFDGLVVAVAMRGIEFEEGARDTVKVRVAAGEDWPELVRQCLARGCYGLENLSLIPGSAGAAPVRNIGAYGVELATVLTSVAVVDVQSGEAYSLPASELGLGYRNSLFLRASQTLVVTAIELRLSRKPNLCLDHPGLCAEIEAQGVDGHSLTPERLGELVSNLRRKRLPHPDREPNAGSFFTNPVVDAATCERLRALYPDLPCRQCPQGWQLSAAWLIERAGWKGRRQGAVSVSAQHALVLTHGGDGTGAELMRLADRIAADIEGKYGVSLQPEPSIY